MQAVGTQTTSEVGSVNPHWYLEWLSEKVITKNEALLLMYLAFGPTAYYNGNGGYSIADDQIAKYFHLTQTQAKHLIRSLKRKRFLTVTKRKGTTPRGLYLRHPNPELTCQTKPKT